MNNVSSYATPQNAAGIDVSKDSLDVAIHPLGKRQRFPNTPQGHDDLVALLKVYPLRCVVVESTGGYERAAVVAMVNAGLGVHLAHAATIRYFARSYRVMAKTDKIDADICARFAWERADSLRFVPPIDEVLDKLKALIRRREDLVADSVATQNRMQQAADKWVLKGHQRDLRHQEREIKKVEKEFDKIVATRPDMVAKAKALRQIKGVGPQTTRMVVAMLPELGQEDVKKINSLVGVAPHPDQSGKNQGRAKISGGRKSVRNMLYMACMSAINSNPVIAPHYDRLVKAGKAHKTAMMACIRKLLAHMDAVVRKLAAATATDTTPLPAGSGGLGAGGEAPKGRTRGTKKLNVKQAISA